MTAREAMAYALHQQLDFDIPDELSVADSILAWLWLNGYKVVPLEGDEDGPRSLAQMH